MNPRLANAAIVVIALGAVGAALVSQHVYEMLPCAWCALRRLIFVAIAVAALPAVFASPDSRGLRTTSAVAVIALAAAGIAAALWQHFFATSSASCNLTLADRILNATGLAEALPQVFAPWASCADAAVKLAGISYEFYSLAVFAALAAVSVWSVRRR